MSVSKDIERTERNGGVIMKSGITLYVKKNREGSITKQVRLFAGLRE